MRCLTLAEELRARGADCHFICRLHPGHLVMLIRSSGFTVNELPMGTVDFQPALDDGKALTAHAQWLGCDWWTDARQTQEVLAAMKPDWLVVDHYALDARWETSIDSCVKHLMVIDDLADRSHACNFLLDQNFYVDMTTRYLGRVPPACEMLLGPNHVLLRPEFTQIRQNIRKRSGQIRRILVFFGGSDPTNQTRNVLTALLILDLPDVDVDVVIGSSNPNRLELEKICGSMPKVELHCQVANMAELIERADLGIGAGGVAMWERCYLGLPTITVVFADNQLRTTEDVAKIGVIKYLGRSTAFTANDYAKAIKEMIDSPDEMRLMSEVSLGLVHDGTGQVADAMERIFRKSAY